MVAVAHWPLTYSRDTLRFTSDHAGFDAFFDDMDELGTRTMASEQDHILWACRYAGAESESWRTLPAFKSATATFGTFRKEVRALYPHLDQDLRWTFGDLENLLARTRGHSGMSREDLGRYYRTFVSISNHLISQTIISKKSRGRLYLSGFPPSTRLALARRLEITCPNVIPSNGYDFADVHECATFVLIVGESSHHASTLVECDPRSLPSEQASLKELVQVMAQSIASAIQSQPPTPSYAQSSTRPLLPACAFCSAPDHYIRDCPIGFEYNRQGRIMYNEYGKVVLPDGRPPPRSWPGRNMQERIDYFWDSRNVRGDDNNLRGRASMHYLEVRNDCDGTMSTSTFGDHHTKYEPPATSPDDQEKIRSLQAQIELLRRSLRRVNPPPQYRRVPNQVPSSRPQPSLPNIYLGPAQLVDEAAAQRPWYPMVPIPMPSRPSDEYEFQHPAADPSQMPEPTHEASDISPEYRDEFRRYQDTPSDEPAVNFRL